MVFKLRTYHLSKIFFIFFVLFVLSGCEKKPPVPPHLHPEIEEPAILNGKVKAYETNPEGDIDKIILNQGRKEIKIHFPPHLAKYILEIAKKNEMIVIKATSREDSYELISVSSGNRKTFDAGKILPPKPSPGKEVFIKGTISGFIKNQENKITGFMIGQKTVMLGPEERITLAPLLMKAHRVEVTGLERDMREGIVNTLKFPPIRMTEIKLDSIVYKIR
ncbi:hypothetical protein [Chryseobacterium luteum]|uniref:Lipoprotein n=1 Tax=Chryseobacterium luteum TaxID=421531 RepID=A0A085ZDP2_9FLAO|nr:hypothetical protein [Chryseobacterium luteum]KFF02556.1 hypothetical protein IX38_13215 [Chryseobacterium luteum]